jgi:hypothetical protein
MELLAYLLLGVIIGSLGVLTYEYFTSDGKDNFETSYDSGDDPVDDSCCHVAVSCDCKSVPASPDIVSYYTDPKPESPIVDPKPKKVRAPRKPKQELKKSSAGDHKTDAAPVPAPEVKKPRRRSKKA